MITVEYGIDHATCVHIYMLSMNYRYKKTSAGRSNFMLELALKLKKNSLACKFQGTWARPPKQLFLVTKVKHISSFSQ